jgi:hypothetical protein
MDAVTEAYRILVDAIRESLRDCGFEATAEHHHSVGTGAKYLLLTTEDRAVCLKWDAASKRFVVECCSRRPESPVGVWEVVCEEQFDPETDQVADVRLMAGRICSSVRERVPD